MCNKWIMTTAVQPVDGPLCWLSRLHPEQTGELATAGRIYCTVCNCMHWYAAHTCFFRLWSHTPGLGVCRCDTATQASGANEAKRTRLGQPKYTTEARFATNRRRAVTKCRFATQSLEMRGSGSCARHLIQIRTRRTF